MHFIIESCGKKLDCSGLGLEAQKILSSDPFFAAHLPGLKFYNDKREIDLNNSYTYDEALDYFKYLDEQHLRHFPFFILSKIGNDLLKEKKYIIHGGAILKDKELIIILGPTGTGKSTIIYNILQREASGIEVICDDKFVLDTINHSVLFGNSSFSFRELAVDGNKDFEKSRYSSKHYLRHTTTKEAYEFNHISFYQIRLSPHESINEIAQNDIIVSLYNNILNTTSGNEACALNPTFVTSHHVTNSDKESLLNTLAHITLKERCSSHFIQGSIEFLTENIKRILLFNQN